MSLDGWLASDNIGVLSAASRAALAWRRINDRPTSVVLIRNGAALTAQTMRVESDNTATWQEGQLVATSVQKVTLFGIRDHDTLADTNIARGDRFSLTDHPGAMFEVLSLLTPPGEVQAICEAREGS